LEDDYKYGDSNPHLAAYYALTNVLQRLLSNQTVDKNVKQFNLLPLHYAVSAGRYEAVKLFADDCKTLSDDGSY
jgi:hypothetical protein